MINDSGRMEREAMWIQKVPANMDKSRRSQGNPKEQGQEEGTAVTALI